MRSYAPVFLCQGLHAARGEVGDEPDGRPHAHEHLPQTGDRQDAEGLIGIFRNIELFVNNLKRKTKS